MSEPRKCTCRHCNRRTLKEPLTFEQQKELLERAELMAWAIGNTPEWLTEIGRGIEDQLTRLDYFGTADMLGNYCHDYDEWALKNLGPWEPKDG